MTAWVIRQSLGEREARCLRESVAFIGWEYVPDFREFESYESVRQFMAEEFDWDTTSQLGIQSRAIWRFANEVSVEDWVALPSMDTSRVHLGRVQAEYQYDEDEPELLFRHRIGVHWSHIDLLRSSLSERVRGSLRANGHFFRMRATDAETEFQRLSMGMPGDAEETGAARNRRSPSRPSRSAGLVGQQRRSSRALARDELAGIVGDRFFGHPMETLVEAILRAQGFRTFNPRPGPDGGIDVAAAHINSGEQIVVQVKSGESRQGVEAVRKLRRTMRRYPSANHGILAAWGGVTSGASVNEQARHLFNSQIEIWDRGRIIDELVKYYEDLMPQVRTAIPPELVRKARGDVE